MTTFARVVSLEAVWLWNEGYDPRGCSDKASHRVTAQVKVGPKFLTQRSAMALPQHDPQQSLESLRATDNIDTVRLALASGFHGGREHQTP